MVNRQALRLMINPVNIRRAGREDIPALCELLEELFSIEKDFVPDGDVQRKGMAMLLDDHTDRSLVLVAENGEDVIGMCTVQLMISTAEGGWAAIVEDLVVREEDRETGIGTRLLDEMSHWCREKGVSRAQLLCDRNNRPALGFYAATGWKKTDLIALRKVH